MNKLHTSVHHLIQRMKSKISDKLFGTFLKNVVHAREYNLR